MKKRLIMAALAVTLAFFGVGCSNESTSDTPPNTSQPSEKGQAAEAWEKVRGNYAREDSSQYNNGVLQMMYLDNSCVLFEFRLMEGSEDEDSASDTVIPGVLIVDDDGKGLYETVPDAENPFKIHFTLSDDRKHVSVTHEGNLALSPDGKYAFADESMEVSSVSAHEILRFLPTAATSLNANLGAYTIKEPEELVENWFYPVEAVFDDTGKVLAKFLIAKDLSAVFRADDDIEPALIFGSAQPMLDAYIEQYPEESPADAEAGEPDTPGETKQYMVNVELENGVALAIGATDRIVVSMPWEKLPYALTAKSSEPSVVTVDEKGVINAIAAGEATISGTLTIGDGEKKFSIEISVGNSMQAE